MLAAAVVVAPTTIAAAAAADGGDPGEGRGGALHHGWWRRVAPRHPAAVHRNGRQRVRGHLLNNGEVAARKQAALKQHNALRRDGGVRDLNPLWKADVVAGGVQVRCAVPPLLQLPRVR